MVFNGSPLLLGGITIIDCPRTCSAGFRDRKLGFAEAIGWGVDL